jgi:uncharacterized membrane protein
MIKKLWARVASINVPLVAAALFASAILHILATLATPLLTPSSGYGRLAGHLPENSMQILSAITPDAQPLPFMAPDARYAICRFDTTDGTVALSAVLPEPGWVLSLYSPSGDNFFNSVAGPGRRPEVSVQLVPGVDAWRLGGLATTDVAVIRDATLTITANEGIAVIRAPDKGEAYRARAMADLKRARCVYRHSRAS